MRKRILFILLSLCVCLSGCGKDKEVASNTEIVTLQPNKPVQEESSSQQTNQSSTNKKPSSSKNNSIEVSKQDVTFDLGNKDTKEEVIPEEVNEGRPTVEELQEEEKTSEQIKAEEVLELVRTSMPKSYSYELIGNGTKNGSVATLQQTVKLDNNLKSENIIDNRTGINCKVYDTYYNYTDNKAYIYSDGYWSCEDIGVKYDIVTDILKNVKECKFVNIDSTSYHVIECVVKPFSISKDISISDSTVTFYIDKSTSYIHSAAIKFSKDWLNKNGYSNYGIEIKFGNFDDMKVSIPQEAITSVEREKVDMVSVINTMRNNVSNNYTLGLRYDDISLDLQRTQGHILQSISYTLNGVPTNIYYFFDANLQKTLILKTESTANGAVETKEVQDGCIEFFDLSNYLNSHGTATEVRAVWDVYYAYITKSPTLVFNSDIVLNPGECNIHVHKDTMLPHYIEFTTTPGSLEDNVLTNSERLLTISRVGETNTEVPDFIRFAFLDEYESEG